VATARELEQQGRRYDRAPIKVGEINTFRGSGDEWVFETELEEQIVNVIDANGKVVDQYPARRIDPAVGVVWREGRWWLDGIGE
jgi:hypothetical protein